MKILKNKENKIKKYSEIKENFIALFTYCVLKGNINQDDTIIFFDYLDELDDLFVELFNDEKR